jgi:hypothetical protein
LALIEKVADRMLNLVAPKLTADACACNYSITQACFGGYCKDYHHYAQTCRLDCLCRETCGPCYVINNCG